MTRRPTTPAGMPPSIRGARAPATAQKRATTVYLSEDDHRRLRIAAAIEDKSVTKLIEDTVLAYLAGRQLEAGA